MYCILLCDVVQLVEGVYGIKVSVTGDDGSHGETCVNVTVHSAPRVNKPPHPVITPSDHLLLHLPTDSAILEATSMNVTCVYLLSVGSLCISVTIVMLNTSSCTHDVKGTSFIMILLC